ncbi:MAG: A/G-specific adenine glycosylase [Fibrobacter sp.]|nr:A/G-specific adenine glycosylase [Fibrobacter sp.]
MDATILKSLREWFKKNAAELPWRLPDLDAPRDPYAVWISETMLQQTQVSTVRDYYIRWMKRFPDIETLAAASEEEVFKYWQGLGYYSRARNILKTAQIVNGLVRESGCNPAKMPSSRKELEALPGIGAYTAGAILSLAYHKPEAILDGNLVRIFSRFYALDFLPTQDKNCAQTYWEYAQAVADSPKAYMHNEALMELGRTVCKIKNPQCDSCPLRKSCKAFSLGKTADYPPSKIHVHKDWHGTVLVIESADGHILAVHGGQKFFKNQLSLPHFETSRNASTGLPAQAEDYVNADQVAEVTSHGSFKHNITIHKMDCSVMHILLQTSAKRAVIPSRTNGKFQWIKKAKTSEIFANSFCLKALDCVFKH